MEQTQHFACSSFTVMATDAFESLSEDVLILVQSALDSPQDLYSLISASPQCLCAFRANRRRILWSVLKNGIQPAALRHALAVFQIPPIPSFTNRSPKKVTQMAKAFHFFSKKYFAQQLPVELPSDVGTIINLFKFLSLVNRFIDQYVIHATRQMGLELSSAQFPPLSATERARIQRAFFRYELYSRMFLVNNWGINVMAQVYFFKRMTRWEVEEIVYIHNYLACLITEVVDDLQEEIVQAALVAPGATTQGKLKPYARMTDERCTKGIMTWGRLPGGTPSLVRRHPQPLTWEPPATLKELPSTSATQTEHLDFRGWIETSKGGRRIFHDLDDPDITSRASRGLAYLEDLMMGDANRRRSLVQRPPEFPVHYWHGASFADAVDAGGWGISDNAVTEHPAELETADDPCRESMGYRLI